MSYPNQVRQRALELRGKGMSSKQVCVQLRKEGVSRVPSASTINKWVLNTERGVVVEGHWRSPAEIAEIVMRFLTSDESQNEIARQHGVSSDSIARWVRLFAPDEEARRVMTAEQLEQATLWRVEQQRRAPRKTSKKSSASPQPVIGAYQQGGDRAFDDASLPDDPDELKAMLRHERFMRLADKALFEAVMESEGKAPARSRSTAWSSLKLSSDSGRTDTN